MRVFELQGFWWDIIRRKTKNGWEVFQTEVQKNLIVISARVLAAALFRNDPAYAGVTFMAFGSGDTAWDTTPVAPTGNETALVTETFRKAPSSVSFVDEITGSPVAGPTKHILVSTTILTSEMNPVGEYIREFGVFGGTATITANSGQMVNTVRHTRVFKDSTVEIERKVRFQF